MDPVHIVLLGKPVPRADGHVGPNGYRFVPKRQSDAVATIRVAASEAMAGRPMLTGPVRFEFRAELPIPKWSKRHQTLAATGEMWPTKKPDLKNLAGLAEDALKTVVYPDDNLVCEHRNIKVYGAQPKITITVTPLAGVAAP